MAKRTPEDVAKSILLNPIFIGGVYAVGLLALGAKASTASGRKDLAKQTSQRRKKRIQRQAESERRKALRSARLKLERDFFAKAAPASRELDKRFEIKLGPGECVSDAIYNTRPAGFRQSAYRVSSEALDAHLDVSWDGADRNGRIKLVKGGEKIWSLSIYAVSDTLSQFSIKEPTQEPDLDAAELALRLLAHPQSRFKSLILHRPGREAARRQMFIDHMLNNPELAAEVDWDPENPFH